MSDQPIVRGERKSYFVMCEPFRQSNGNISHGTHVSTDRGPEFAAEVETRLGMRVRSVTVCPDLFTCTCLPTARMLNELWDATATPACN